jgi:hypothetical protein
MNFSNFHKFFTEQRTYSIGLSHGEKPIKFSGSQDYIIDMIFVQEICSKW